MEVEFDLFSISIGRVLPHPRAARPSAPDSDGACDTKIRVDFDTAQRVTCSLTGISTATLVPR